MSARFHFKFRDGMVTEASTVGRREASMASVLEELP